jgi:hypothetical protein
MYNVCEPGPGDCTARHINAVAMHASFDKVYRISHTKDITIASRLCESDSYNNTDEQRICHI